MRLLCCTAPDWPLAGAEAVKPQKEPPPPLPVIQPTRRAPRQPAGGRKQGQPGKAPARQAGQGGGVPGYGRGGSTFGGGYDYSWDEDDSGEERSAPRPLDLGAFLNLPGGKDSEVGGWGGSGSVGWGQRGCMRAGIWPSGSLRLWLMHKCMLNRAM